MTSARGAPRPHLLGVARAFDGTSMIEGDVRVADGRIVEFGVGPGVGERLAAPGFVDLQLNGFGGVDLQTASPGSIVDMGEALLARGVTAYQPTVVSAPVGQMARCLEAIDEARAVGRGPHILGAHLEGPFLSPRWAGAHPIDALRVPDPGLVDQLLRAGKVGYVTLAPELPGALDLVRDLRTRGVVVALGHSNATAEQAQVAYAAGVSVVTHALNAQRPLRARDPGPLAAALANGEVWITVIADGVHLAPLTLALVARASGQRLVGISDAMAAAGLGDGHFEFGSLQVVVRQGFAALKDGTLVGSTASLDQEVRQLVAVGLPLEDALAAVTSRPAAVLGDRRLGVLVEGGPADVAILGPDLYPVETLVGGGRVDEEREVVRR